MADQFDSMADAWSHGWDFISEDVTVPRDMRDLFEFAFYLGADALAMCQRGVYAKHGHDKRTAIQLLGKLHNEVRAYLEAANAIEDAIQSSSAKAGNAGA